MKNKTISLDELQVHIDMHNYKYVALSTNIFSSSLTSVTTDQLLTIIKQKISELRSDQSITIERTASSWFCVYINDSETIGTRPVLSFRLG